MEVCCCVHGDAFVLDGNEEEGGQAPCCALILTAFICHTGSCYVMVQAVQGLHVHLVLADKWEQAKTTCCYGVGTKSGQGSWGLMGQPEDGAT